MWVGKIVSRSEIARCTAGDASARSDVVLGLPTVPLCIMGYELALLEGGASVIDDFAVDENVVAAIFRRDKAEPFVREECLDHAMLPILRLLLQLQPPPPLPVSLQPALLQPPSASALQLRLRLQRATLFVPTILPKYLVSTCLYII